MTRCVSINQSTVFRIINWAACGMFCVFFWFVFFRAQFSWWTYDWLYIFFKWCQNELNIGKILYWKCILKIEIILWRPFVLMQTIRIWIPAKHFLLTILRMFTLKKGELNAKFMISLPKICCYGLVILHFKFLHNKLWSLQSQIVIQK